MDVYITGMGMITPLGRSQDEVLTSLLENKSAIRFMPEWQSCQGLKALLGAPSCAFESKIIPRNIRRSMSKMSEMAYLATEDALQQANLKLDNSIIDSERVWMNLGSTTGSPTTLTSFFNRYVERGVEGQFATDFFKIMNHSVAANVASALGYCGPLLSSSSACSSSTQALISGYEMIQSGFYDIAIVGGADELHVTSSGIFDLVQAASRNYNNNPEMASRPFDKGRDGLVVAEGAGALVLESEEHLKKRGANPLAKVLGGAYLCDGAHMSQPQIKSMIQSMKMALKRSQKKPEEVDYINAHATATIMGDIEESNAIYEVFGDKVPVSSIKGHMGHTLAACGAIETITTIMMISHKVLIPNRNLFEIDPNCSPIELLKKNTYTQIHTALINNFAFGGMSSSLIIERV